MIPAGARVGMSGFTGAGYPKAVPQALADRATQGLPNVTGVKLAIFLNLVFAYVTIKYTLGFTPLLP